MQNSNDAAKQQQKTAEKNKAEKTGAGEQDQSSGAENASKHSSPADVAGAKKQQQHGQNDQQGVQGKHNSGHDAKHAGQHEATTGTKDTNAKDASGKDNTNGKDTKDKDQHQAHRGMSNSKEQQDETHQKKH
jgi:hypothetical protein